MTEETQHQVPYTIRKLGSTLARALQYEFRDNLKVEYHAGMAYNYCEWSLLKGYKEADIRRAFLCALEKRHIDATDAMLSKQQPNFKFKLSSTVSLARELLQTWEKEGKIEKWKPAIPLNDPNANQSKLPSFRM